MNLQKSEDAERKNMEELASDCYNKFEISYMQHMNDSAEYYLNLRASLDTLNADWQIQTIMFVKEYLSDYDRAKKMYMQALSSLIARHGEKHVSVAKIYNNLAVFIIKELHNS